MKISIYTAVMIFLFIANGFAQEPTWFSTLRKIEPIKSTEKDVEKIFGKPVKRYANIGEYNSEIGEISVFYSVGKCGTSEESEYDVDEGLVVDFSLLLRKKS